MPDYVLNTISQRLTNVAMKLGNRQDLLQPAPGSGFPYSRISGWLRDAYIAISAAVPFEQTETGTNFITSTGQDTYPLPGDLRALEALTGYRTDGTPVQVDYKNISYIRRYNQTNPSTPLQGTPSIYTLFQGNIIFRPVPDQNVYTFFLDYWQWPNITTTVDDTVLQVPMDWLEIIDYEASVRGNAELQQADKSREIQQLLYGFTNAATGDHVPGIIERAQNRLQAGAPWTDWGIQPSSVRNAYTAKG